LNELLEGLPHNRPGSKTSHRYSLLAAIRSACEHGTKAPRDGLEAEVSQELARRCGPRQVRGFLVPLDIACGPEQRTLDLGQGAGGVATIVAPTAIDALRRRMVCSAAGALVGNFAEGEPGQLAMPRLSSTSAAAWVGDGSAPSESNATLDQVLFTAHTCTTYTDITRRMLKVGTRDFQDLVLIPDLTSGLAHEVDRSAINGPGNSNQPLGLLQHAGITSLVPAADSGNGGAIALADVVSLEQTVGAVDGDAAADCRMAFVASPQLRSKLRRTPRGATDVGITLWDRGNTIMDYPAFTSTSVPANITQGGGSSLSCLLYGNFRDLAINLFTAVDIVVNPFLQSVSGVVRVSAFLDVDVMPRHNGSFAKLVGAVTA
jgi:HK97 family phage major capsid protein